MAALVEAAEAREDAPPASARAAGRQPDSGTRG
jgi:hypothetical protein